MPHALSILKNGVLFSGGKGGLWGEFGGGDDNNQTYGVRFTSQLGTNISTPGPRSFSYGSFLLSRDSTSARKELPPPGEFHFKLQKNTSWKKNPMQKERKPQITGLRFK